MVDFQTTFRPNTVLLLAMLLVIVCLGAGAVRAQNNISANNTFTAKNAGAEGQDKITDDESTELPADFEKKLVGGGTGRATNPLMNTGESRGISSPGRTFGSLMIVLALIIGGAYLYKRLLLGGRRGTVPAGVEVLARNSINPKQTLCLVKLGGRLLLLGLSPNQMTALQTIDDPDEVAELIGMLGRHHSQSISKTFGKLIHQESEHYNQEDIGKHQEGDISPEQNQPWYQAKGELSSLLDKVKGLARMRWRP
ncbi:FliO/MopB family protein [Planctomycetota bacterium]